MSNQIKQLSAFLEKIHLIQFKFHVTNFMKHIQILHIVNGKCIFLYLHFPYIRKTIYSIYLSLKSKISAI